MTYRSRVSLLLALGIALLSTLFLLFVESAAIPIVLIFGLIFGVSFLVSYILLELLIFRELKKAQKEITHYRKKEVALPAAQETFRIKALRKMLEEVDQFAEQKQTEIDDLKKLEAFRREFIADVSHELKTPIFAAQGFVHTLLDGAVNDKTVRNKFLKKAAKSLDGLDALVQDLLTLSHIETGQIKMHFENLDMYKLTEEVFEQFENKADKKDVHLRIDGPERKVIVYADWQRMSQVMTNLVSNALKYSNDGGEVVVSFELTKKNVRVRVTDFGEGIPPEHVHRIFERFYRVDKSRSREKGGTGLGLAIVKHILDGHHTKPEVTSKPGQGSTFSFTLPRAKAEVPSAETDTTE